MLSVEKDITQQAILEEALNDSILKYRKKSIAQSVCFLAEQFQKLLELGLLSSKNTGLMEGAAPLE